VPRGDRSRSDPAPLPSHASAGEVVAGLLGTLEQLIANRPRPPTQIEEEYRDPWASADGLSVDGLDEPMDRPEPPDTTGARL
jgi:hypothetical protein